ncbi:hypothetical protein SAMN05518801_12219 [Novosphingobium sp. CF614]|uniref:hypothetical protein n=1 Tax=Novosphingobium sp. CF614 TaxID=1884364 RepID=UPI0008EF8BB6|nr:hypothetical protein [Novosphingobium sp. CF614]SFG39726.1 hypothetical protein SAMN05518801_12219 [Novosphingobium sp. CF614]
MNFVSALLYPIALLLPAASGIESDSRADAAMERAGAPQAYAWPAMPPRVPMPGWPVATGAFQNGEPEAGWQVRIEQRMQIRITPRASLPMPPDMFVGIPDDDFGVHFSERKIGNCLSIAEIGGVQPDRGTRLLLYMRDRRLVAAELERSCRARDFYSGFYLARTPDGQLCIDRDTLLSRSGMNCKLTRIRQLVESDR